MLLGSEKGEVMLLHNGDLRGNISVDAEAAINAIVPTSKVYSAADATADPQLYECQPLRLRASVGSQKFIRAAHQSH